MSIQFVWNERYSVGNPEIDQQHKRMFELANSLPEVASSQDVRPLVLRLFKYTREHFSCEEEMMRSIGYPLVAEHVALHEGLIGKLCKVSEQPLGGGDDVLKFKEFVYAWLVDHIMTEDNKYFQFVSGQSDSASDKAGSDDVM
ncbi:MAG: hemerythrin family protein [Planctomycetota bacterium]|jgi:hemerythrin|nr:hemerythrin family protein [Planctomycetota bacterium]